MYSTVEDVRLALVAGGGSTDLSTAASLSDLQIEDSIREADSTVDTYIAARHSWDRNLEPAPDPMRWLSRDIAAYLATLVYRKGKDLVETDPIVRRYNHAMRTLLAIAAGTITIQDPNAPSDTVGEPEAYNLYNGHLFGSEDLVEVGRFPTYGQQVIWPGH